jgi:hypothetical protein
MHIVLARALLPEASEIKGCDTESAPQSPTNIAANPQRVSHTCSRKIDRLLMRSVPERYPTPRLNRIAVKRIRDIERYLAGRYGHVLPEGDDAAAEDLVILLNHIAQNPVDPRAKMRASIHVWGPWMDYEDRRALVDMITKRPYQYKAETLGQLMRVTEEEHALWRLESIRAHTVTDSDMKAKKQRRERERLRAVRAANRSGRKRGRPRTEGVRPWDALGMSRAQYYRLKAAGTLPPGETPRNETKNAYAL